MIQKHKEKVGTGEMNIKFLFGTEYLDKVNNIAEEILRIIESYDVRLSDAYTILDKKKQKIDCSSFSITKLTK